MGRLDELTRFLYYFPLMFMIIWKENHPLKSTFFYADLPIDNVRLLMLLSGSDLENSLSPNYSKFAVECDGNGEISQNAQFRFFFRNGWVSFKKS